MEINWSDKNILIVEDEQDSFLLLKTILKSTKATIFHAQNGQQAIDHCNSNDKVDVVLMDIQLPVKNGFVATKEIKALHAKIPIIAQTAFAMQEESRQCLEAGCDNYISKPINRKILLDVLSEYLDN